jgi:hypothetical protein
MGLCATNRFIPEGAATEGVNELESSDIPLLEKEGNTSNRQFIHSFIAGATERENPSTMLSFYKAVLWSQVDPKRLRHMRAADR